MASVMSRPTNRGSQFSKNSYTPAQVQNVKKSRVYVFGDADIHDDDDVVEFEMGNIPDIRSRKAPKHVDPKEKEPIYFEREITEGDSLQSMSLQYGCQVSELKRINNMIADQDFFARRVIKVPIKQHSHLSEVLLKEQEARKKNIHKQNNGHTFITETNSDDEKSAHYLDEGDSSCNLSDPETQNQILRTLSIGDNVRSQSHAAQNFLQSMDKDFQKIRNNTDSLTTQRSLDEVVSHLTNRTIEPFTQRKTKGFSGADCGLTWWKAVICMILVVIIIPLFYFILMEWSK